MRTIAKLLTAAVLAAAVLAMPARRTGADEAVASLAKYRQKVDASLDKALAYLAGKQTKDGYWPSSLGRSPAVASLAVMAFCAKGHTPGTGPYGDVINKGIDFVLSCQKPNGLIAAGSKTHGAMYVHGMATLMLSQVSGMLDAERQQRLDKALPHAVRLILTAQQVKKSANYRGGWRYQANSKDSDISLTGWQLMSLRSARNSGAQVPRKAIQDAIAFVLRCRRRLPTDPKTRKPIVPKTGGVGFAYQPGGGAGPARTGIALLCLELCGHHRSPEALAAGDYVLAHRPKSFGASYFYYTLYYSAQGMFQLGGKHWEQFAPHMYQMMLKFQRPDGSWPQGSSGEATAGPCYSTAMGVLAMAVSYRQLPIYQR